MTNRIEHKGLGIDFELPEIKQRQVEQFARAQRRLRREQVTDDDDLLQLASDAVAQAVRTVKTQNLRLGSPDAAAAIEIAARKALRIGAEHTESNELSVFEVAGETCRAAARLGWLGDVKTEDVDEWLPAKTALVTREIQLAIIEAQTIPPNS